jgi:hypothetical protein
MTRWSAHASALSAGDRRAGERESLDSTLRCEVGPAFQYLQPIPDSVAMSVGISIWTAQTWKSGTVHLARFGQQINAERPAQNCKWSAELAQTFLYDRVGLTPPFIHGRSGLAPAFLYHSVGLAPTFFTIALNSLKQRRTTPETTIQEIVVGDASDLRNLAPNGLA